MTRWNTTLILALTLLLSPALQQAKAQPPITDTGTLRNAINTQVVPNNNRQITAAILNRILNGAMNVMPQYQFIVDTTHTIATIYNSKRMLDSALGTLQYEPPITAPHANHYYWNGYKQFAALNADSIANGTAHVFWNNNLADTGWGLNVRHYFDGSTFWYNVDSSQVASVANARRIADSAAGVTLPSQAGNSGKYLTTNGSSASWVAVSGSTNYTLFGSLYNKNYWTSTSDFSTSGLTASVSSNKISVVSSGVGVADILCDTTALENWHMFLRYTVNTAQSSNSYGMGVGQHSISSGGNFTIYAYVNLSTSGAGKINIISTYPSTSTLAISTSGLTYSNGDSLELSFDRSGNIWTAYARDVTTNSTPISASAIMPTSPSGLAALPNTSRFSIIDQQGTYQIDSISVVSNELKNANILCLGDSKTYGYYGNYLTRWATQLKKNYNAVVDLAGGGDKTADIINRLYEVIRLAPAQVILEAGTNDPDSTTTKTNLRYIDSALTANGITVYHTCFYQPGNAWRWNYIQRTFPHIINCYSPLTANGALGSDAVHPSNYGDSLIYTAIISTNTLNGATPMPANIASVGANGANYIPISSGSAFSNSNLYEDANGDIGLGTSAPYEFSSSFTNLDIRGSTSGVLSLGTSGSSATAYLTSSANGTLYLSHNLSGTYANNVVISGSTGDMAISNSASVGDSLSITGPLLLFGNAVFSDSVTMSNSNATNYLTIKNTNSGNAAAGIQLINNGEALGLFFKNGTGYGSFKNLSESDVGLYTATGNISFLNDNSSGNFNVSVGGSTSAQLTLASNGNFSLSSLGTGTVYSNSGVLTNANPSDRRLKHLIAPVKYGLKEILQLRPVSFYYNSDSTNKLKQFGFIAQEVQKLMPDVVRPLTEGSPYLGIEKDAIYSAFVNAIKELQAEIVELKMEIKNKKLTSPNFKK